MSNGNKTTHTDRLADVQKLAEIANQAQDSKSLTDAAIELVAGATKLEVVQVGKLLTETRCGTLNTDKIGQADCQLLQLVATMISGAEQRMQTSHALQKANSDLRTANKEFQTFAYAASHDLSQQLGIIIGFLDLLQSNEKGNLHENSEKFIQIAMDGARDMQGLIKDLLDLCRVQTHGTALIPTDSSLILEQALESLESPILSNKAELCFSSLPKVMADPVQLRRVFISLIDNAIKFRSSHAPLIKIDATVENEMWRFSVSDNGLGFEMRFAERIFVMFQRLHTADRYPGHGAGLTIAKKIIERHGGELWVESVADKGSVFYFTLPYPGAASEFTALS